MRRVILFVFTVLLAVPFYAATNDPVVIRVNGQDVRKSEFEYFFRKNNADSVITRKTIRRYADMYLDFKLKVQDAISQGVDTTQAFRDEFKMYRDLQAESYLIDNDFIDEQIRKVYDNTFEQIGPAGMAYLLVISQVPDEEGDEESMEACIDLMNSVYDRLCAGEDFRELAAEYSCDEYAEVGGELGWVSREDLPDVLNEIISNLRNGMFSKPFVINNNVYIVQLMETRSIGTYEEEKADIINWARENTTMFTVARYRKANEYASNLGWDVTDEAACARLDSLLEEVEPEFGLLAKEVYDGLLMYDVSSREVWNKVNLDSEGMKSWFEDNRGKYSFDGPRFKGMVFFCSDESVFRDLEAMLKDVDTNDWLDSLVAYNKDKVYVRVMRGPLGNGIFKEGQNAYVDNLVFGTGAVYDEVRNFPYVNTIGKIIDKPETVYDMQAEISEGYQKYLEQQWVQKLRKQYKHKIYRRALRKVSIDK